MARDDRLRYDSDKKEFYYENEDKECCKKKRCCKSKCYKKCKKKSENICDPPDPDCVDWCETCSGTNPIEDPCDPCDKKCKDPCKKSCNNSCDKKCKKRKCGRFRSRPKSSSKSKSNSGGRYGTRTSNSSTSSNSTNRMGGIGSTLERNTSRSRRTGESRTEETVAGNDINEGIIGWIKTPFNQVEQGANVAFNAIQESDDGDVMYDQNTDEFIINNEGVYALKWNINVSPVKNIEHVYITFTLNDEKNEQILTGVKNIFKGVNGIPNIVNSSYLVFSANEGDRYSLNNSTGAPIKILFLDSSIGGKVTIDRIQ